MGENDAIRFVSIEECNEQLQSLQDCAGDNDSRIQVWKGMKWILEQGYIIIFDTEAGTYRTVIPGQPMF